MGLGLGEGLLARGDVSLGVEAINRDRMIRELEWITKESQTTRRWTYPDYYYHHEGQVRMNAWYRPLV
jgi:hypothetical protein